MTEKLSGKTDETTYWYAKMWHSFKQFPSAIAQGSEHPPTVSGPASAALISASIGCLVMMITHHLSDTNKGIEKIVWVLGYWIPGSHGTDPMWGNIGSYSGKETMLLVGWLVSWPILHFLWKDRMVKTRTLFMMMLTLLMAATAMCWHPLFPYLPLT